MSQTFRPRPVRRLRAAAGFTLAEVMVTLAIFAIVIVAILAIFDINGRIARVEGHVTDMQQSLRIAQTDMVRIMRMGARGGLPAAQFEDTTAGYAGKYLPSGVALEIASNVPANTRITGDADAPSVLEGTDILTVRGVFSTVYQANPAGAGLTLVDVNPKDGVPESGSITLSNVTPTGVPQDLQSLADAIKDSQDGQPGAFLMANPHTDFYAVVEIEPASQVVKAGNVITQVTVAFTTASSTSGRADFFRKLAKEGRFPQSMETVAYVGVLEEYRYYIRDSGTLNAANVTALEPVLARARVYPGTDFPYKGDDANLEEVIADDIFDLQVALAVDVNNDSVITEGTDAASRKADEWLFNDSTDDATVKATWNGTTAAPAHVYYVRVSTLARTARRDSQPQWQAARLGRFEDKDYTQTPYDLFNSATERKFRRQSLQTVIDLRSLS